jgi:hypothetical protein
MAPSPPRTTELSATAAVRHKNAMDPMEHPEAAALIERYKAMLSHVLLRRAVEGPLPEAEEAQLAQGRADLWDELPEPLQLTSDAWIDQEVRRAARLRNPAGV